MKTMISILPFNRYSESISLVLDDGFFMEGDDIEIDNDSFEYYDITMGSEALDPNSIFIFNLNH